MGEEKFDAEFTFKESADARINKYEKNVENARKRMQAAKTAERISEYGTYMEIPNFKLQRTFDETTGKASYELVEGSKKVKAPEFKAAKKALRKGYYEARAYADKKISEYEDDNTGLEAAHKAEEGAEWAAKTLKNTLPSGKKLKRKVQNELHREAKRAEKRYNQSLFNKEVAESKAKKAGDTFLKASKETGKNTMNSLDMGKNAGKEGLKEVKKKAEKEAKRQAFHKLLQKKARKEFQKQAVKKAAKQAAIKSAEATATTAATTAATNTAVHTAGTATGTEAVIGAIYAVIAAVIIFIILIAVIIGCILAINFFNTNVKGAMYQSDPEAIEEAELHMTYLEASLKEYMEEIEDKNPGYDGYITEAGDSIGHNPYTLINYLSAKYTEFSYSDVEAEIDDLFNTSYTLYAWVEDIEVTKPPDPDSEDEEEEEETITLHILHIKLERKSLEGIVKDRMNNEEKEMYEVYGETHGGFEILGSPTGNNYEGKISSYYGYRYHPINNNLSLHRGLDIALPEGTELHSAVDGIIAVVGEDSAGYGKYVVIKGDNGVEVKYAHMSEINVNQGERVERGSVFGKSGNTGASTGPHVHVEVKTDGQYYNPLFYLDTE